MAHSCTGFNNRYFGLFAYTVYEVTAAARYDKVHSIASGKKNICGFASGREQGGDGRVNIMVTQHIVDNVYDSTGRIICIVSAF